MIAGEHELEVHERGLREMERRARRDRRDHRLTLLGGVPEHAPGSPQHVPKKPLVPKIPDRSGDRVAEAHLERPQTPGDQHERERDEREHHAVDRPALLHDAAVQDGEARKAHQPDERRRGHLPRVVAGVEPTWVREPGHMPPFPCRCGCARHPAQAADRAHQLRPGMKPGMRSAGRDTLANTWAVGFRHLSRRPAGACAVKRLGLRALAESSARQPERAQPNGKPARRQAASQLARCS